MRSSAWVLCCSLCASVASAQAVASKRDTVQVLQALVRIEEEIARANKECDYRYFARVEAAEFTFTDATGRVTTRAEDLAGEKDCRKADYAHTIDEPRLQVHGDVAILSARSTIVRQGRDGQPVTRRSRFTDVFVWRDARWQLASGHSSNIPAS